MGKTRWLILVTFLCLFAFSDSREFKVRHRRNYYEYNHTLATILVEYASAVYLSDLTELFTWTCSRCYDLTKAFVGVAEDPHAIIIAFRGTNERSLQNWIEDLYWKQHEINYPGMDDAMVHRGFYTAYHNTTIRPAILDAVERAKKFYGDIQIIATGHSMGGAMASFCGLDLTVNQHAKNVQVMTFGQPRIGNAAFASLYHKLVPNTFRITNDHDVVPHLPPYYYYLPQKTYRHFPREVWLYNIGFGSLVYSVEKICDGSGEDPTCSRSVSGNSITDHLTYYGVDMGSDTPGSCRIVMDPHIQNTSIKDSRGNFILSRDPATPLIKLSREIDNQENPINVD
ncbi:lipase-like isoform X2 [Abrus precatorius]|uniref:Lipase-like isoform X2 n=1 Tax=Abrus precatorius TaxID=3816 RepID=A0A8B8MAL8_ABRPR|nr:lipase-like isoform X2 [Abrus precatorius]